MRLLISQTTLLFDKYLLINLSLHMTTAHSNTTVTPPIVMHSAAISEVFTLKIYPALAHDRPTINKRRNKSNEHQANAASASFMVTTIIGILEFVSFFSCQSLAAHGESDALRVMCLRRPT